MAKKKTLDIKINGMVQVGTVPVDSGSVVIVDPCYLDEWKHGCPAPNADHIKKLKAALEQFKNTEDKEEQGRQIVRQQMIDDAANYTPNNYAEVASVVLHKKGALVGVGNFGKRRKDGWPDYESKTVAGVASSTGIGDSVYPVYAKIEGGRVMGLLIDFGIDDFDRESHFKESLEACQHEGVQAGVDAVLKSLSPTARKAARKLFDEVGKTAFVKAMEKRGYIKGKDHHWHPTCSEPGCDDTVCGHVAA